MPTLHLNGTPRVTGTRRDEALLSAREAGLLAWLHLEGPTPRARIAGLLWPAGTEARSRANLRQLLVRLKRGAGELVAESDGVLRLAAAVQVAVDDSRPLLGTLAFDDAADLADWLQARRDEALRRHQRETLARARQHLEQGEIDAALAAADTVLASHPESEQAWRVRMESFCRRGDRASALQAWDDCRLAVRAAFGVAPSAETQALGERILDAELPAAGPAGSGGLPPALRRPPQLIGRDAVLAGVQRCLALGHGAVVLGPAGIGKSRLLAEVAARFGAALVVGARPGDIVRPGVLAARLAAAALRRYEPVLDAATRADIDRLLPLAPGDPEPVALHSLLEHRRVLGALARGLHACRERGLRLLVIDDLQFADDASLEALQVLLGLGLALPPEQAVLPLLGLRPEEASPAAVALVDLLAASGRGARFDLPPLEVPALRTLLADLALPGAGALDLDALAAALLARVGGNPAFVLESLKSLCIDGLGGWAPGRPLPLPPTLRESVRRRLQRLSPEALQLAQLAAVAQGDFDLALAAAAAATTPLALAPRLAELAAAQVFDGQSFAHDLVADAVQQSLPPVLAATLHGVVAGHLIDQHGAAASIAVHLQAAGQTRRAADWLLQAGQQARARWQHADAARAMEAAARALDLQADRALAFGAWREAARCWNTAGQPDAAGQALDRAAALATDAREDMRLRVTRHTWYLNTQRYAEAAAAALGLAAELPAKVDLLDDEELAGALVTAALSAPHCSDATPLLELCNTVRRHVAGRPRWLAPVCFAEGLTLNWLARPLQALPVLRSGWDLAQANDLRGDGVNLGNQLIRSHEALGDLDAAIAACVSTRRAAADAGAGEVFAAELLSTEGFLQVAAGRVQLGHERLAEARRRHGGAPAAYLAVREALSWLASGRIDRAEEVLAGAGPPPASGLPLAAYRAWTQLRVDRACGRPAAHPPGQAAAVAGPDDGLLALRGRVVQARHADPARAALPELQALLDLLHVRGLRAMARSTACAAALAACAQGRPAVALAHARAAVADGPHVDPWCDETAAIWRDAAQVLAACGRRDEARAAAAAGAQWVRQAAAGLVEEADRRAWCEGHAVHRELLCWAGSVPPP